MRRITIGLRSIQDHRGLGVEEPGTIGCSKLPILNMRLLGAIALALITLITLSNPEPVHEFARMRVARGELGARIVSCGQLSPTSARSQRPTSPAE